MSTTLVETIRRYGSGQITSSAIVQARMNSSALIVVPRASSSILDPKRTQQVKLCKENHSSLANAITSSFSFQARTIISVL